MRKKTIAVGWNFYALLCMLLLAIAGCKTHRDVPVKYGPPPDESRITPVIAPVKDSVKPSINTGGNEREQPVKYGTPIPECLE